MKIIDIGKVSEQTGVNTSTLRYYEEIGLIASLGRRGLRRQYGPEVLLRLALIQLGKKAGFSLDEIGTIFLQDNPAALPRPALHQRVAEIENQIRDLEKIRDLLQHVAECRAPSQLECPRFRKLLKIAARPERKSAIPRRPQ